MPSKPNESFRKQVARMASAGEVDELVALVRSGAPLTGNTERPAASWDHASDLLLAYKDSKQPQHPQVYEAWVDTIQAAVPPERLHAELATVFLPVLSKQKASPQAVRALLNAIERVFPNFLQLPLDEQSVPKTLISDAGLLRKWKSGQPKRTVLGLLADTPAWYAQDLWEVCLPATLDNYPLATEAIDLLEYLPATLRENQPGTLIRQRLRLSEAGLARMGEEVEARLADHCIPMFATDQPYGFKQSVPKSSALGLILRLDAGAVVSQDAWRRISAMEVTMGSTNEPLPLPIAIAKVAATKNAADRMGLETLRRMVIAGVVNVNALADPERNTLLHIAAGGSCASLVGLLLENGADANLRNAAAERPRDIASSPNTNSTRPPNLEIAALLDAHSARAAMTSVIGNHIRPRPVGQLTK